MDMDMDMDNKNKSKATQLQTNFKQSSRLKHSGDAALR